MLAGRRRWKAAAIFAAAYLLVLQSLLGAFAFGTGPKASQLDAFGNVICTHDGAAELPAGDRQQQRHENCCLFGCSFSVASAGVPLDVAALLPAIVWERIEPQKLAYAGLVLRNERTPANPRAPPLQA